ncbi:hypothetical protein ATCC90586_012086 [Pythium insidiosum]|nr:hypothetical protein ATCC90586_012086 [Pythium insidiosum]
MRAHIGKIVKAHCAKRQIGIYKSFKDNIGPLIDAWKRSDQVQYTRGGNPKQPSIDVVTQWVRDAWRAVPNSVVATSITRAGFSVNVDEWHIARHDVYGAGFLSAWEARASTPTLAPTPTQQGDDEICDAFDDISLIDQ